MNKSFIERIFPHTPGSVLPQYSSSSLSYHDSPSSPARSTTSSAGGKRITLRDRSNSPATSSPRSVRSTPTTIRQPTAPPLSASIIHHDDPFLPVERAAKALEKTLQDLINAQSDALELALPQDHHQDDLSSSMGSATPTPSASGISRSTVNPIEPAGATMPKVIPIRQPPPPKRISLRHARKGLARTMDDFARLKREEVRIIATESSSREAALRQASTFQTKLTDLQTQLETAQHDGSDSGPAALRKEAENVEREIRDLEHRLFSLRARHAQLGHQAEALENAIDSKLSSFKHSIAGIERETRQFLSRPPVRGSLVSGSDANSNSNAISPTRGGSGGMYALPPSRLTLPMATEQWTAEQTLLSQRRDNAEREAQALTDGAELWRNATSRISAFEKSLRARLKTAQSSPSEAMNDPDDGGEELAGEIDTLTESLENDYARAEANGWRLLMVAVGAELAALGRARELLVGASPEDTAGVNGNGNGNGHGGGRDGMDLIEHEQEEGGEDGDGEGNDPPVDLLDTTSVMASGRRLSNASNESLQATLEQFSDRAGKGKLPLPLRDRSGVRMDGNASEDDDDDDDGPSADFLVSHS